MSKHRQEPKILPWRIYRHYLLNQWHYFQKPRLKKRLKALFRRNP